MSERQKMKKNAQRTNTNTTGRVFRTKKKFSKKSQSFPFYIIDKMVYAARANQNAPILIPSIVEAKAKPEGDTASSI